MKDNGTTRGEALKAILACLEDEAARRADGAQPGSILFDTGEIDALVDLLRREVGQQGEADRSYERK